MTSDYDIITSASNPIVKTIRSLDRKKARSETGLFLAEGARIVEQGLAAGWTLETLVLGRDVANRPYLTALAGRAEAAGARIVLAGDALMGRMARKDNPQTALGTFRQRHMHVGDLPELADGALYIALYEVRDPGNLGTILRTADCAGADGVILVETCCDPFSVEAVRASMGSLFDVTIASASVADLLDWRARGAACLVAASMTGTTRHDAAVYGARTILLMGNEQAGLPGSVEGLCDHLVRIPMRGGADSLNLAQATAILTYEAWRQRDFDGAARP